MKKQKDQTKELLNYLVKAVKGAGAFVLKESPEVIKQLILWQIVSHAFATLVCTIIFIILYRTFLITEDVMKFLTGFGLIIDSILGFYCIECLLQIIVAPKVFLLEYLKEILSDD